MVVAGTPRVRKTLAEHFVTNPSRPGQDFRNYLLIIKKSDIWAIEPCFAPKSTLIAFVSRLTAGNA